MPSPKSPFYSFIERSFLLEWLLAFVLVIIARLPYLLSDHVYFDGDEAMLGIMGRDLITGQNLPIYFYGQRYGFSFFEALSVGIFIPFLGSGVASLKLGGMLLFSLGIQRYMRVFRVKEFPVLTYSLVALILVLFPTWLVWGTKLRGGYITAFVGLAFIAEQLLLHSKWERKNRMIVSSLSALTLVSQPFFLLPVLPILIQRTLRMSWPDIFKATFFGGFVLLLLRAPVYLNRSHWTPSVHMTFEMEKLRNYFLEGFWANFTGYFAFSDIYDVPMEVKISAMVFFMLMVIGLMFSFFSGKEQERNDLLLLLAGIFLSIFPVSFFGVPGGRYIMPFFTGWMILLVFILSNSDRISSRLKYVFIMSCILTLSLGITRFDRFVSFWMERQLNDMKVLNELVDELRSRKIETAFVSEWQVLWQLNYLANEDMHFRYLSVEDRLDRYVKKVNECYLDNDCKVALTGSLWPLHDMQHVEGWSERIVHVNERFYIMEDPEDRFLLKGGFELPEK